MAATRQTLLDLPEDFPIEDAEEEIEVTITTDDIRRGRQRSPELCAFARAERRSDTQLVRVAALKTTIYLIYPDHAVRYILSKNARDAIAAFDDRSGKMMKPGVYTLHPIPVEHGKNSGDRPAKKKTGPRKDAKRASAWIRGKEPR